jgi:adenylate cyclase
VVWYDLAKFNKNCGKVGNTATAIAGSLSGLLVVSSNHDEGAMKEKIKKLFSITPLKITLFIIFIALAFYIGNVSFLQFMELKALDLRMKSRGKLKPGGETVIAVVDEKSLKEIGRWPWPRTTMAKLVDTLHAYGAKAVGFDIVFAEPDQNSSLKTIKSLTQGAKEKGVKDRALYSLLAKERMAADTDAALAHSIKKAGNVTVGYFFHLSKTDVAHLSEKQKAVSTESLAGSRYQMVQTDANLNEDMLIKAYAAEANLPEISAAAQVSGYFNAYPDDDGVIRWSPLITKMGDDYYHSLAIGMLLQYFDWPNLTVKLGQGVELIKLDTIEIPTDESGRMLINYLGPAKTFPHYSISDILYKRLSPEFFKDKIVLIGVTATGVYDLRVTPFGTVYPGVEIHANVIDNILHRNFLKHALWTKVLDLLSIICFGLVMGIAVPRFRAVQGIALCLGLLTVFDVANTFIFSHYNIWLNLIYPTLTMMTIYLGITIYRYVTEEKEKKKIRGAFQYYLTAPVNNKMLKAPTRLKLGGDKKDLTVLFSDIRGFTTVSEKLTPEELVHLLNEYLTAMTDIVFKYDGLLDKYMGDAIMAVYGAPLDQPDHPLRACRTALDMIEALKKLQDKWSAEGRPVLNIGVGINTGEMVVGNMGSQMRFDYTVMGDSVNLGSRLEGINKEYGTNIVISEFTYEAVKDTLLCRELDSVRVKGKKLPVRIYELVGVRADAPKWEQFLAYFNDGLAKYKGMQWDDAIAAFRKTAEIRPGDPPAEMYIGRCLELKAHPPEGAWDGVFTMTRK